MYSRKLESESNHYKPPSSFTIVFLLLFCLISKDQMIPCEPMIWYCNYCRIFLKTLKHEFTYQLSNNLDFRIYLWIVPWDASSRFNELTDLWTETTILIHTYANILHWWAWSMISMDLTHVFIFYSGTQIHMGCYCYLFANPPHQSGISYIRT